MLKSILWGPRRLDVEVESSFVEPLFRVIALVFIVLAARFSWGPLTHDPQLTSDDFSWAFHAKNRSLDYRSLTGDPVPEVSLVEQVRRHFVDSKIGHYEPIGYSIWTIEYLIGGDHGFVKLDFWVTHVLHILGGFLLLVLLRRFLVPRGMSFAAAIVVIAHPVNDISVGGINGALILRATVFLLASVLLWLRGAPPGPRRPFSLIFSAFALFCALNIHPIMLAIGPLLLLAVTLIGCRPSGIGRRSFVVKMIVRATPLVIVFGGTLFLRHFFYGTIGVKADRAVTPVDRGNALYEQIGRAHV